MADDRNVLRWVSWRDCCPWILLFRTFAVSITLRALLLATVGSAVTWLGWLLIGLVILGGESQRDTELLREAPAFAWLVQRSEARPGRELESPLPAVDRQAAPLRWEARRDPSPADRHPLP